MTHNSPFISIEQAIAKIINFDYIPEGFSVLDMTKAFMDEAKAEYERAQFIGLPSDEIFRLKYRYKVCKARHELADALNRQFYSEFSTAEDLGNDHITGIVDLGPSFYLDNLSEWVADKYGISLDSVLPQAISKPQAKRIEPKNKSWKDITLKIYADNYLGYTDHKGKVKRKSFSDINLMGIRKNQPNELGTLLLGLSHGEKFPKGCNPQDKEKTLISKLRKVLKELTGIDEDPFYLINPTDGWKPKFTLIDDRKNADNRAAARAIHVSYDDNRDAFEEERPFDNEEDIANEWLKSNQ